MSYFDAEVFSTLATAHIEVKAQWAKDEINSLKQDIEATLAAIEIERDSRRRVALLADLETFLPARKQAIKNAENSIDPDLSDQIDFTIRVTLMIARSFK